MVERWLTPAYAGEHPEVRAVLRAGLAATDPAGARHEVVGPAAHLAPVEQPEAVNRLILEHMR